MKEREFCVYKHSAESRVTTNVWFGMYLVIVFIANYISKDNWFLDLTTGLMIVTAVVISISKMMTKAKNTFNSKAKLQAWVDTLDED